MSYQKISNKIYSNLAVNNNFGSSEKAGRYISHSGLEKGIFNDIKIKLNLKKDDKLLDIGCGCGPLVDLLIKYCNKKKIHLTLCDIPDVIDILKKKYLKYKNIHFLNGEFQNIKFKKKFNKILCYSVIQCVNKPRIFYKKILDILTVDGKVLVGDLPNVNRKYRFLKSSFGKKFEEKRLKKKIKFNDLQAFLKITKQNKLINDRFIEYILRYSKKKGRNCFLMKQSNKLPFSYTREDILIEEI